MEAPASSKAASPIPSSTGAKGDFYLQPRSKVGILGICLTLMIAASVYAVLQDVNPDLLDTSLSARLWYPRETNPHARLPGVRCANDYACRLNSVAVNGAGELPEVWAVGNVGLVLHRKAGQRKWEQLTITATAASAAAVLPTPTPMVTEESAGPAIPIRPLGAAPSPTPVATPTPGVRVPSLIRMRVEEAQKIAAGNGFQLQLEYEGGRTPSEVQQGPPSDYRVVKQSPDPGTLAPAKSTITVFVAPPPKASLLDHFETHVYAAEPEEQPRKPAIVAKVAPGARVNTSQQRAPARPSSAVAAPAPSQPNSPTLDDDLINIVCDESNGCRVLGRSGRIYKVGGGSEWTYVQAAFTTLDGSAINSLSLRNAIGPLLLALAGTETFRCEGSLRTPNHRCFSESTELAVTKNGDVFPDVLSFSGHPTFYTYGPINQKKSKPVMLVVGESGFIANMPVPRDLGQPLTPTPSGTTSTLRSFSFDSSDSNSNAFIAGDHGVILSSSDGGNTWRHETQGPEGAAPNHRLPAVWYWVLAGVLIITCSAVVAVPAPPPPTEFSVADWTVTDAPLKPGDVDSLGFTPMALGLSRFIRNPKTQPPVTIAIEGNWGKGKSSVMALLQSDLEKSRFRPVWFNAWHHQSEEQLLAALLEHIKDQLVPAWWHIDNWIFRAHLVRIRFRGKWPLLVLLASIFFATVSFEFAQHSASELAASPQTLIPFKEKISEFIQSIEAGKPKSSATDPVKSSQTESSSPENKPSESSRDLRHFGLLASALALLTALLRTAQAFGFDSSKLVDNLRDAATVKDVKPDPGIRPRFAHEFGDVCEAWSWGGRRVIIFIDDLDRCRPESVVTVLESINFLTNAGECVMVLGIARQQVTRCVGLSFKDIANEEAHTLGLNTEGEMAAHRFGYGTSYINKLVNIFAPLPETTPEQRRAVLEARAAEVRHQTEEEHLTSRTARWRTGLWEWVSQAGNMSLKIAPVLVLLAPVVLAMVIGYNQGVQQRPEQERSEGVIAAQHRPEPTPTPQARSDKPTVAKALVYDRPTSQPAALVEPDKSAGGVWWSFAAGALFLLLILSILAYQLSTRTNQDAQNSPEFEESLKLWGQYIADACDTPREIKRALNDLRYQAMTRRNNGPSSTRGERLIRAMRRMVTGRSEKMPVETRVDEAALPPRKAATLAYLGEGELEAFLDQDILDSKGSENLERLMKLKREHISHFQRWIGEAQPVTESAAPGAENPPSAKAAHQA